jgi:hypothetical protein
MRRLLLAASVVLLCACSHQTANPVAPQPAASAAVPATDSSVAAATAIPSDTHGHRLTAVSGTGTGIVNVTPTSEPVPGVDRDLGFAVVGELNVHGAPPNTTFLVQRKPDFNPNGICEGANFITVPLPRPGPLVTLTTSPSGAGAAHFSVEFPTRPTGDPYPKGLQFDVMFRLWESSPNPGAAELRTECFTVTVK